MLLKISDIGEVFQVGSKIMPNEVACLDICHLRRPSGDMHVFASVGLWTNYLVLILSVPNLSVHETLQLDTTYLLRSVMATEFSDDAHDKGTSSYLFVGLGDGTLVSWQLSATLTDDVRTVPRVHASSKKTLALGTRPITMYRIQTRNLDGGMPSTPAVFVASDRSTIISRTGEKLTYASVNMKASTLEVVPGVGVQLMDPFYVAIRM